MLEILHVQGFLEIFHLGGEGRINSLEFPNSSVEKVSVFHLKLTF